MKKWLIQVAPHMITSGVSLDNRPQHSGMQQQRAMPTFHFITGVLCVQG